MKPTRNLRKGTKKTRIRRDPYQAVTDAILKKLESGTVPWRRPWNLEVGRPKNFQTGKYYQGINVLLLGWSQFASPFWLTFRQATLLGGRIRKGEKGTRIVKYGTFRKQPESESSEEGDAPQVGYFLREYVVFNGVQIEGIEFPESGLSERLSDEERSQKAEQIAASMPRKPLVIEGRALDAAYFRERDLVEMPAFENFRTADGYYLTLFHELTHATGHPSRMNRKSLMEAKGFRSESYSKEELVAEMGAAFLGAEAEIVIDSFEQSVSYLQGWLEVLGKPNYKRWIVQAAAQASKATDFILGRIPRIP